MVTVIFKSVKAAQKVVPHAGSVRQSFANSHISRRVRRIGRHKYLRLYNKVSRQYTDIYTGDIEKYWSE